jgi:hypothetical protein
MNFLGRNMATERWNDAMLDDLAATVNDLAATVKGISAAVDKLLVNTAEQKIKSAEQGRRFDALIDAVVTQQSALRMISEEAQRDRQIAQERYAEQNQRFNILLEEVRATNRRVTILEEGS